MTFRKGCSTVLVAVFAIVVALTIASAALEAVTARTELADHNPPGELVFIRPHRMHIDCQGEGRPIILLEAGRDRFGLDWWPVHRQLAAHTTVCAYDRAGLGWSGRGPGERKPERIADELHELLLRSEMDGPYVIAAMDSGAQYALWYASAYPDRVVGLAWIAPYIDATSPVDETRWERAARVQDSSWSMLSLGSRLGLWPWVAEQVYTRRLASQDPAIRTTQLALMRLPAHFTAAGREAAADEAYLETGVNDPLPEPPAGVPRLVLVRKGEGDAIDAATREEDARSGNDALGDIPEARWRAMQVALRDAFAESEVIEIDSDSPELALAASDAVAAAILEFALGAAPGGVEEPTDEVEAPSEGAESP